MKRTIVVCGHGPGISDAVARKFGHEGLAVAIVARSADRLSSAATALEGSGKFWDLYQRREEASVNFT